MPGTSIQNLIDLDMIFKNQSLLYTKDPYLNNANSLYRSNILKEIYLTQNLQILKIDYGQTR